MPRPCSFNINGPLVEGVGCTVLMDKWDPEETLRLVEEHKVTPYPHGSDHVPSLARAT